MAKLSNFIVALLLISLVMTTFAWIIADMGDKSGVSYNITSMSKFQNHSQELIDDAQEIREKSLNETYDRNLFDIIGQYFGVGFSALKISAKSIDVYDSMSSDAFNQPGMGRIGTYTQTILFMIVFVVIVIGVVIAALLKWVV